MAAAARADVLADPADVHLGLHGQLHRLARERAAAGGERAARGRAALGGGAAHPDGHVDQLPRGIVVAQPRPCVRQPDPPLGDAGGTRCDLVPADDDRRAAGDPGRVLPVRLQPVRARPGAGPVLRESDRDGLVGVARRDQPHPAAWRRGGGAGLVGAVRADAVLRRVLPGRGVAEGAAAARAGAAVGACVRRDAGRAHWRGEVGPFGLGDRLERRVADGRAAVVRAPVPPGANPRRAVEYRGMMETRFWLIRHAIVAENERAHLYGIRDVQLCPDSLVAQLPMYQALARRLPRPAVWGCTPLSRTRRTAEAIFGAGYPVQPLFVEPGLIEQNLGELQGLKHAAVPALLTVPAHPFWPLSGTEVPPGGESVAEMLLRVGEAMERLARSYQGGDVVVVSHGGAIRAAVGHAMRVGADPV